MNVYALLLSGASFRASGYFTGASYPTMTEAVVTLAKIKKGLLKLHSSLTIIEPFNVNSGIGRMRSTNWLMKASPPHYERLGGRCRRLYILDSMDLCYPLTIKRPI